MNQISSAELVRVQEHLRGCLALSRFCNHVANETADQQLKTLCNQLVQQHQQGIQRLSGFISAGPSAH